LEENHKSLLHRDESMNPHISELQTTPQMQWKVGHRELTDLIFAISDLKTARIVTIQ